MHHDVIMRKGVLMTYTGVIQPQGDYFSLYGSKCIIFRELFDVITLDIGLYKLLRQLITVDVCQELLDVWCIDRQSSGLKVFSQHVLLFL